MGFEFKPSLDNFSLFPILYFPKNFWVEIFYTIKIIDFWVEIFYTIKILEVCADTYVVTVCFILLILLATST